ncbi:MAG: hypothetical protein IJ783_11355 [Kiritimatiellae bacterium]|nr:hypothetical protein [Kiritimatiellia bacterium]
MERFGISPEAALWGVPAALLLLLLGQAGPQCPARPFGTAAEELSRTIELPD